MNGFFMVVGIVFLVIVVGLALMYIAVAIG